MYHATLTAPPMPRMSDDGLEGVGWTVVDFELEEELSVEPIATVSNSRVTGRPIAELLEAITAMEPAGKPT